MRRGRWFLRAAGVSAWILSGIPALLLLQGMRIGDVHVELSGGQFGFWMVAALVFLGAFWWTTADVGSLIRRKRSRFLLLVQTLAALSMFHLVCTGLETTLLAVVAAQLGLFFPLPFGLVWVCSQTAALIWLAWLHWGNLISLAWIGLTTPFVVLSLFVSYFAASQAEARRRLFEVNNELRATQALLSESSRISERTRISRELHDLLGHHLVALSLNLEAALHGPEGDRLEPIRKSQDLTKRLLNDLRSVVRQVRGDDDIDLARVLSLLHKDIPQPQIHLDLPEGLRIDDADVAHTLVRCVQEIVTNTVKHAEAQNLWIQITETAKGLEIQARDDGRGLTDAIHCRGGLEGMRERLRELGGDFEVGSGHRQGFFLNAVIPLPGGSA